METRGKASRFIMISSDCRFSKMQSEHVSLMKVIQSMLNDYLCYILVHNSLPPLTEKGVQDYNAMINFRDFSLRGKKSKKQISYQKFL